MNKQNILNNKSTNEIHDVKNFYAFSQIISKNKYLIIPLNTDIKNLL